MKVIVKDYTVKVSNDLAQKASIFIRLAGEEIVDVSKDNTPMKTGALRRDVLKETLGTKGKVVWTKDYASKQEEIQHKRYTTPGTGPHFAKNAVNQVVQNTEKLAKNSGLI